MVDHVLIGIKVVTTDFIDYKVYGVIEPISIKVIGERNNVIDAAVRVKAQEKADQADKKRGGDLSLDGDDENAEEIVFLSVKQRGKVYGVVNDADEKVN